MSDEGALRSNTPPEGRCTVWLLEDSRLEAERVVRVLAERYTVEVFTDGPLLLERLAASRAPDALILDWNLPGMSGLEVCRFVRSAHDKLSLPILMLTVYGHKPDLVTGLEAGANDHVTKPYDAAELLARIEGLVEVRRLHREACEAQRILLEREAQYRKLVSVVESSTDLIGIATLDGDVEFLNDVGMKLMGFRDLEEVRRHRVIDFFFDADKPFVTQTILPSVLANGRWEGEFRFRHRVTGEALPVHYNAFVTRSREGATLGLATVTRDLRQQKREEAALHEAESRLHHATRSALRIDVSDALSGTGTLREMLLCCAEAMVRHLHVQAAHIYTLDAGKGVLELQAAAGPASPDGAQARVAVAQTEIGAVAEQRAPLLTSDLFAHPRVPEGAWARRQGLGAFAGYPVVIGQRTVGVMALYATEPLAKEVLDALAEVADIIAQAVERKRAEQELEKRAEDLVRSNADLEQFAYVASHDLQEPLRMVSSFVQLLARRYQGKLDADADRYIAHVVTGVGRMQRLINDLLAYSRVGKRAKSFAPTSIEAVLAQALEDLGPTIVESGARITHDPLPTVMGDEGLLQQLFINLLGNAIKFRSAEPPHVHVSAREVAGAYELSVADNGMGIEERFYKRIFVIFQRLHSPSSAYTGTGIGLAICKKIVERHGGRIWVESAPTRGSIFRFTLPAGDGSG